MQALHNPLVDVLLVAAVFLGWWANNALHNAYERAYQASIIVQEWLFDAFTVVGFVAVCVVGFGLWRGWWF